MIMIDSIAIDTNVLVYCHSSDELEKRKIANSLLAMHPVVSTQVLSEYLNVVKRRLGLTKVEILDICRQNIDFCRLEAVRKSTLDIARELILRYDFQLFDSIVVVSAVETGCKILYSEDFQHGQIIENELKIINPFL